MALIQDIWNLIDKFDEIEFKHVFRQANRAADFAASMGHHWNVPCIWETRFSSILWKICMEDKIWCSFPSMYLLIFFNQISSFIKKKKMYVIALDIVRILIIKMYYLNCVGVMKTFNQIIM